MNNIKNKTIKRDEIRRRLRIIARLWRMKKGKEAYQNIEDLHNELVDKKVKN